MPELPEVETVRRGLTAHLPARELLDVELRRDDLRWPIPCRQVRALAGSACIRVRRRAKYLLLDFSAPAAHTALIHLGMSGRLFVDATRTGQASPPWLDHEHWRMTFRGRLLRYLDPRRFGMLDTVATAELADHKLLRHLGPEPLDDGFDGESLFAMSRKRKTSAKTLLMDARRVVGVGNIYASEACFRAGVRPRRAAGRLTADECTRLALAVKEVLNAAIQAGGTTLRDYRGVDQDAGYFQQELFVYERAGQGCRRCETPIRRIVQGARSTYYCPSCQS